LHLIYLSFKRMHRALTRNNHSEAAFSTLNCAEMGWGIQAIEAREGNSEGAFVQYECKCSFLQIYNEELSDLLIPSENRRLTIRTSTSNNHSTAHDVWVDNLSEHVVLNGVCLSFETPVAVLFDIGVHSREARYHDVSCPDVFMVMGSCLVTNLQICEAVCPS
jgi:hypothetical protein